MFVDNFLASPCSYKIVDTFHVSGSYCIFVYTFPGSASYYVFVETFLASLCSIKFVNTFFVSGCYYIFVDTFPLSAS